MRNQDNWQLYYQKTSNNPPRDTLVRSLGLFKQENIKGLAFDLGSGACNDVDHLLNEGWKVVAIDNERRAQEYAKKRLKNNPKFSFKLNSFYDIEWEPALLIHAGFALPFCPRDEFEQVMENIKSNLLVGGRFAGNFFGPNHSWKHLCLKSKKEILSLFDGFEIEYIEESETPKTSTLGEELFHHNIKIIAKKLTAS